MRESEADGPAGPCQRHVVRGFWGEDRAFAIERRVERWEDGRRVLWRDLYETLDGAPPPDMWHRGTTPQVRLDPDGDGTLVTVTGRQLPAAGWERRLEATRPATIRMLEESLAALECAAGEGAPG